MNEKKEITNPVKVIRAYCLDCANNQPSEITNCPCTDCVLYKWRFGKNPYRSNNMSEERRQELSDRMRSMKK